MEGPARNGDQYPEIGTEGAPEDGPTATLEVQEIPWWRRGIVWVGIVVGLIGAGQTVFYYVFDAKDREIVACQRGYANALADVLDARTDAQRQVVAAQDELWFILERGLAAPSPTIREEFQHKLTEYRAARERAKTAPPYPAAPREVCEG